MTETLNSSFDAFLYTPIGEDNAGTPQTVLSMLARQDLDPWAESAALVRLPQDSATARLVALLAVPAPVATRLVELLHAAPKKPSRTPAVPTYAPAATQAKSASGTLYFVLALVFVLIGLWAMAVGHVQTPEVASPMAPFPSN